LPCTHTFSDCLSFLEPQSLDSRSLSSSLRCGVDRSLSNVLGLPRKQPLLVALLTGKRPFSLTPPVQSDFLSSPLPLQVRLNDSDSSLLPP